MLAQNSLRFRLTDALGLDCEQVENREQDLCVCEEDFLDPAGRDQSSHAVDRTRADASV